MNIAFNLRMARIAALLASGLISGCTPYPIYKKLQPDAQVHVVDQAGVAVAGAVITLMADTYPYGREHHRQTLTTDSSGSVSF